jgi:hypothetical protein
MKRKECAKKGYEDIMELKGADQFKAVVRRLRKFQDNKEKYSLTDVTLPNYLWVARRGGGVSTCTEAFAEYLYNARIIDFTGKGRHFEYRLTYTEPDAFFSELTRLNNTISEMAGHYRYFRGVACINIDEWKEHINEPHFYQFLDYIASNNDKVLAILYVCSNDKQVVKTIESSLSSRIRSETVWFRFPKANELVDLIEFKSFKKHGFSLTDDAKSLLADSIERIIDGEHFNGFKTIKQLANDILFSLFESSISSYEVSANMLAGFSKESAYVRRLITSGKTDKTIGFDLPTEEHLK